MTYLCCAITVRDLEQSVRDCALAAEAGADLVELRIDSFASREIIGAGPIAQLVKRCSVPCVVTCRPVWEGGASELADEERMRALAEAAGAGASLVDIELKTLAGLAGELPGRVIASSHDFVGRPDRLHNLLLEMEQTGAAVNKIAWAARTVRNNLEAFELLADRRRPTIALCMGEAGLASRVLAKKFGAFLTFASLHRDSGTAPGQVSLHDMKRLYRWDAIGPATRVYGVVGHPIAHSMSPAIHNAAFDADAVDGVYIPLLVNPGFESFKAFIESFAHFPGLDLSGLSVTIPHKENALRYLREVGASIEPLAERIGAVNTIRIDRAQGEVKLAGRSTDYAAILDSVTAALGITREALGDCRVGVIGAGGTGRTAAAAFAHYGAAVVVYNRTRDRADALAREFDGRSGSVVAAPIDTLPAGRFDILINASSIGMHPRVDESPIGAGPAPITPGTLVFDAVYNPLETRLLRQAREVGARTIDGLAMFVRQAAAQFEWWTSKPAPEAVMRQVVTRAMTRANGES